MKKARLRNIAKQKTDGVVLAIAQGQSREGITEEEGKMIRDLYMEILETNNLS